VQREVAAEHVDGDTAHDVHAHAAAAVAGRGVERRQARHRDEIEDAALVLRCLAAGATRDVRDIDAGPVVADADLELRIGMFEATHRNQALGRLTPALALGRWLDRVIDGVADQMDDRGEHALGHRFVELGAAGVGDEAHGLTGAAAHAAHDQRHALEQLRDGHHARAGNRLAQVA
jgi:hypothetical protein